MDAISEVRRAQGDRVARMHLPLLGYQPGPDPADIAQSFEAMSLVEVLQALQSRGIDYGNTLDKTQLVQMLVADIRAEAAASREAEPTDLLERLSLGAPLRPSDLLVVGNAHQQRMMAEAMGRATRMPEPEPECAPLGEPRVQEVLGVRLVDRSVMGQAVWPSARVLGEWLPANLDNVRPIASLWSVPLDRPLAIEVGAGCGLPSLAAARAGFHVVATDQDPDVINILRKNAELNGLSEAYDGSSRSGRFRTRVLDWADEATCTALQIEFPDRFGMVYGSDIVYSPHDIRPLISCATMLLKRNHESRLVLASMRKIFGQLAHTLQARAAEAGLRLIDDDAKPASLVSETSPPPLLAAPVVGGDAMMVDSPSPERNGAPVISLPDSCGGQAAAAALAIQQASDEQAMDDLAASRRSPGSAGSGGEEASSDVQILVFGWEL